MKKTLILLCVCVTIGLSAQNTTTQPEKINSQTPKKEPAIQHPAGSVRVQASAPIVKPYDENDIYMGRTKEFLNQMVVEKLPDDFPKYQKEWSVKDYNAVVDAYYTTHLDILKENTKQKILLLKQKQ